MAARIARRATKGSIQITFAGLPALSFQGEALGPDARVDIQSPRMLWRLWLGGVLGFSEAYMAGECDTPDLKRLMQWALANEGPLVSAMKGGLTNHIATLIHRLRPNTRIGSRRNIRRHYDLSNEFYRAWLDPTMTYSSALFEGDFDRSLEHAQQAKYERIAEMAGIEPHHHVLEIGCGWGGFAIWAAQAIGCRITAITISEAQYQEAGNRVAAAGLDDRIVVRLIDYRDIDGRYDRIVSIEMMEAVGEQYWSTYGAALRERLNAAGRAVLQVITIDKSHFETYRRRADFIQAHVFPGGMLPSPERIEQELSDAGLRAGEVHRFGVDYAETLRRWRSAFDRAWPEIKSSSFDERLRRMWDYYLVYCEVGFEIGRIDVGLYAFDMP